MGTPGTAGANGPSARIHSTTPQELPPNGELIPLTYDQARFDTGGLFNPAFPTRLTATVAGTYQITTTVLFAPAEETAMGSNRGVVVRLNGTVIIGGTFGPYAVGEGSPTAITTTTLYRLEEGDYVETLVNNTLEATTMTVVEPNAAPEFMMVRVEE